MTKSVTEKKRVRRGPQNGGRYLPETPYKKGAQTKDVYQLFAEKVRDNKQLSSRWAIMQETRVEYFGGKDFTVFMKKHPELREILGTDKDLDVDEIVNTLLSKHLLIRCDRLVKTLRPGKKKLSSWPAHLQIHTYFTFRNKNFPRMMASSHGHSTIRGCYGMKMRKSAKKFMERYGIYWLTFSSRTHRDGVVAASCFHTRLVPTMSSAGDLVKRVN